MMLQTIETYVATEVDIDEFTDDELIKEVNRRGMAVLNKPTVKLIEQIWEHRRQNLDYQPELTKLIYSITGHIL